MSKTEPFVAGNWKSNKTLKDAIAWTERYRASADSSTKAVICAPYTLLPYLAEAIRAQKLPLELGAQDISQFDPGAYTGEVYAEEIADFATWVIIGHSERRTYFGETDDVLNQKVARAISAGLQVIYCVPDEKTGVPKGVSVVAYEPVWAIGTGKTDTPENANTVIASIKSRTGAPRVIYGGSVKPDNVASFISASAIDGVLPGGASLDPDTFASLVRNAYA